ncbi:hypothetical protein EDC65_1112 [Stella humosa]|uniref:Uncharacterized protein n=1 Tax=Stella humosa TaxID=94 RepID=A0A3N1MFL0_9PROT|nr:hypothetical protein [Stella humosa]ROQ01925.1 hypothetical protein EDC65_1112 [Stella humosa]BBK32314.1 hypothetical protein STHU_29480 [Stella humosa]
MPDPLTTFCEASRAALRTDPGVPGREEVRRLVEGLVRNPDFVAAHVGPDAPTGKRTLYQDPELGFVVLGYHMEKGHRSPPHDHGRSWAIYAQVSEHTDMTLYRRKDGGAGAGPAEIEVDREYRLGPGQAGLYDGPEIHAIDYPAGARYVRVTGCDLDHMQRLRYDMAGGEAKIIESASAS